MRTVPAKGRMGAIAAARATAGAGAGEPAQDGRRERARAGDQTRLRLIAAMVQAIGRGGYHATTVADVIGLAGASRKTFYQYFTNKQDCFLAAYDMISARATRRLEQAYEETEGWPDRVQAAIGALFSTAIENPAALRLATVEIGAAGRAGIERRERSITHYMSFILDAARLAPGNGTISEEIARAIVGGVYRMMQGGVSTEHLQLVPELGRWAAAYYPAPPAIAAARPRPATNSDALEGGRAPGTLAPHSGVLQRRGLRSQSVSANFLIHNQRERILDAVANLTASKGYEALGVNDIAEEAVVSLSALYEHFADKQEALLTAYELGHSKGLALVERAYAAQPDWPKAVRAGLAALLRFLASEPAFAHLALVEALTVSPDTAERSRAGVADFARMLIPGLEEASGRGPVPAVTIEAIVGGIFELCLHYAVEGRTRELPELISDATYIALAPFLGTKRAARVAVE